MLLFQYSSFNKKKYLNLKKEERENKKQLSKIVSIRRRIENLP